MMTERRQDAGFSDDYFLIFRGFEENEPSLSLDRSGFRKSFLLSLAA